MKLKILDEKEDQQEIEMFIFIYVYINQKLPVWIIMKPKTLRKFRTYNTGTKSK